MITARPDKGLAPRRRSAFTVVELLVALAITVTIAVLMLELVVTTLDHWHRVHSRLLVESQARRVLDQLASDLQAAVLPPERGAGWLRVTVQRDASVSGAWVGGTKPVDASFDPAAESLADARFGVAGCWLRFVTTRPSQGTQPDEAAAPVAVSYQLIRRAPTPGGVECRYQLYRAEVAASATLGAGYDLGAAEYASGSAVEGAAGNMVSPPPLRVLADNVIDLGVRLYGRAPAASGAGNALIQCFPTAATAMQYPGESPPGETEPVPAPCVADVMIRILTDEGARRIAALEAGFASGDWWTIAVAHSRVFTQRIAIATEEPL